MTREDLQRQLRQLEEEAMSGGHRGRLAAIAVGTVRAIETFLRELDELKEGVRVRSTREG